MTLLLTDPGLPDPSIKAEWKKKPAREDELKMQLRARQHKFKADVDAIGRQAMKDEQAVIVKATTAAGVHGRACKVMRDEALASRERSRKGIEAEYQKMLQLAEGNRKKELAYAEALYQQARDTANTAQTAACQPVEDAMKAELTQVNMELRAKLEGLKAQMDNDILPFVTELETLAQAAKVQAEKVALAKAKKNATTQAVEQAVEAAVKATATP